MKLRDMYAAVATLLLACIPVSWAFAGWAAASGWGTNAVVGLALGYPAMCLVMALGLGLEGAREDERQRKPGG